MTRCRETINVQDWLDGTLEPEAAARFEAHLAGCPACEAEARKHWRSPEMFLKDRFMHLVDCSNLQVQERKDGDHK